MTKLASIMAVLAGWTLALATGASVWGQAPDPAPDAAPVDDELALPVLRIFAAKCAACHDGSLARPKGEFGDVMDLAALRSNPDRIEPGAVEASLLFDLIDWGEMPPPGSEFHELTSDEKNAVRQWIEAGAPVASAWPVADDAASASAASTDGSAFSPATVDSAPAAGRRLTLAQIFGRMHPLTIHFPIAMLLLAAPVELARWLTGLQRLRLTVMLLVYVGTAGALLAVLTGLVHADHTGHGSGAMAKTLDRHQWSAFTALALAAIASVAVTLEAMGLKRWRWPRLVFRIALLLAAAVVAVTGHFGGKLVYGENFLPF